MWFFSEIHVVFRRLLQESQALVVSGYGFADPGINSQILQWILGSGDDHLMVLIHHDPNGLRKRARAAFSAKMDHLVSTGKVRLIEKRFEDVSWQEVKAKVPQLVDNLGAIEQ